MFGQNNINFAECDIEILKGTSQISYIHTWSNVYYSSDMKPDTQKS